MIVKTLLLYELFQLILHGKEEIGVKGLAVFLAYKKALTIGDEEKKVLLHCHKTFYSDNYNCSFVVSAICQCQTFHPGANVIKLFLSVIYEFSNQGRVFVPGKLF